MVNYYLTYFVVVRIIRMWNQPPRQSETVDGSRRLPVSRESGEIGECIALVGNLFLREVTIHNSSRSFLDRVYLLDFHPSMGQVP